MNKGNIYKIVGKNYPYRDIDVVEFIGVFVNEEKERLIFIGEDGRTKTIYKDNLIKYSFIRNYSKGARELLKERYIAYKEELKIQEKIKQLNDELNTIKQSFKSFKEDILHAKGLLSYREFIDIVYDNLSVTLKNDIKRNNFEFEEPYGIGFDSENNIYLSRNVDIEKWFRSASFLYEEYDGTIHFDCDCEKDKNYKRILNQYSKKLGIKAKFIERLNLGDKNWLYYSSTYEIPLKKPMTKEYAIELAKKISNY